MRVAVQVFDEVWLPYQVLDADAEVALAPQAEPVGSALVEPENLVLRAQQHRTLGHRSGESPELAQQRGDARAMELFAAIDAADDRHYFAPQPADVGRLLD